MSEQARFRLRVRYGKRGRLALLSHLEVTHALERIVRRSGLPFALSQGFSPHMKLAFGPALPVGAGGAEEVFDVLLTDYVPPVTALEALRGAAPSQLAPESCAYVEPHGTAASVAFNASAYEVVLDRPLRQLVIPAEVTACRKGKERVFATADFLMEEPALTEDGFTFKLLSRETGSLRADLFAKACLEASSSGSASESAAEEAPRIISLTRVSLVAAPA